MGLFCLGMFFRSANWIVSALTTISYTRAKRLLRTLFPERCALVVTSGRSERLAGLAAVPDVAGGRREHRQAGGRAVASLNRTMSA